MTYQEILNLDGEDLMNFLLNEFYEVVPENFETIDDTKEASRLMSKFSNSYFYLMSLLSYAKIYSRRAKREQNKTLAEDFVDKKDIINNVACAIKLQYQAVSRAITIRSETHAEMNMSESRSF